MAGLACPAEKRVINSKNVLIIETSFREAWLITALTHFPSRHLVDGNWKGYVG